MNFKYFFFLALLLPSINAQSQNNKLEAFNNLINKTWIAEGKWGDGSLFKQEVYFEYSLKNQIIVAKSKGYTNLKQTEYGLRNHGIRKYDAKLNKVKFWEFDVFGNLTEGTVIFNDKNIIYNYDYQGTNVTDMWEYVNDNLYNFKVGIYKNNTWENVFLKTQFKLKIN